MKKKNFTSFLFSSFYRCLIILMGLSILSSPTFSLERTDQNLSNIQCSVRADGKSLQLVFDMIQHQTKFNIICVTQASFLQQTISINAPGSNLADVLKTLSRTANFSYTTLNNKIIIKPLSKTTSLVTMDEIIKGRVTDSKKEGIPGISVSIKGTRTGTSTNQEGDFSIKAKVGDVLVLSALGFKVQEITIDGNHFYNIIMEEDSKGLSEVVVTALGVKKEKAKLGYAVQEVQGEALVKAREPNVINSLTGRVAGLNIQNSTDLFQDPQISLRGRKPLIVIDGIPDQSADLWKINADDIESMSVLKGAGASALYGSIGQNGAIMITTKRGKGKDLTVDVNSSTEFQPSFIRIPEVQTLYGNGFKGKYTYVDGSGGGPEGSGWIWGPKLDQVDPSTPSGFFETPQFNSPIDPKTGKLVPLPFISRGKNNVKDFFRTGLISSNNISISQSSDKGAFRASASHLYQLGIVPNTDLKNSSFNVSGNYKLSEALTIDARVSYNKQYTNNFPETGYGPTNYLYNLILWTGADVSINDLRNYWVTGKEDVQQRNYNNSYYNNPYFQAYEYLRGYDKDNTFASLDLNYKISPSFSIQFRNGINTYGLNRNYKEPKSYIGYSNKSKGQYTVSTGNYFDIASDLIGDYNHKFSDQIKLHAQVGVSNYYRNYKYGSTNTDGLTIPGLYNLSNSINPLQGNNFLEERRTSSVYAIVDLELLNGIYVTGTGRNDIISTLPTANNSFFYPSIGTSVIVSEFVSLPKWFSYLKARGTWARVSSATLNDNAYTYSYLATYDKGTTWNNTPALSYGNAILNSSLQPQTSDSWELGIDTKFFGNRLGIEATYYQTKDYTNIVSIPISISSGFGSRLENGNEYERKGLEFVLSGTPVKGETFRWDVMANFSQYRRYLKEIYGGAETLNYLRKGDRTDKIFTTVYQKDPLGNVIYGSNGFPLTDNFQRFIGYQSPDWTYGLENTFSYKNVSLKFLVDGRLGGMMYSTTNQKMWWGGTNPGTVNHFRDEANAGRATFIGDGVIITSGTATYDANGNIINDTRIFAPNTKAVNYIDYMTNTSNGAYNNYNYFSQTFLKLREVTLTWQLPEKWLNRTFIKRINLSAVGRNLLLFSKMPNVDPDPATDNLQTPSTRTFGFNANFKF